MSELQKLGGYVVQGSDYPTNLTLKVGSGINATVDEEAKTLTLTTDETVLYSGDPTSACALSEPISSFERLAVYTTNQATTANFYKNELSDLANGQFDIIFPFGNNQPNFVFCKLSADDNSLMAVSAQSIMFSTYTNSATFSANVSAHLKTICKVVGIGRK